MLHRPVRSGGRILRGTVQAKPSSLLPLASPPCLCGESRSLPYRLSPERPTERVTCKDSQPPKCIASPILLTLLVGDTKKTKALSAFVDLRHAARLWINNPYWDSPDWSTGQPIRAPESNVPKTRRAQFSFATLLPHFLIWKKKKRKRKKRCKEERGYFPQLIFFLKSKLEWF